MALEVDRPVGAAPAPDAREALARGCGRDRPRVEEIVRGSAGELAARYAEAPPRGEVVLVLGGAPATEPEIAPALEALRKLVEAGAKPRPASSVVASLTGVKANALYRALMADPTGE